MSLVPVDTSNGVAVSDYLSKAREWLATAVEMTGPEQIAAAKAEIATAAEATKQLNLSRDIKDDAMEMVRRAEYALGKAIRKGQEEGTVALAGRPTSNSVPSTELASPSDFASDVELYDRPSQGKAGILSIADSATPEEFEEALTQARAEGNLSRANVARKVKGEESGRNYVHSEVRAEQIAALAEKGATSAHIAKHLDIGVQHVRNLARIHGITIRADIVRGKRHHIDHNRVLDNVTESLEVAAISLRDIDPEGLDREEAAERLDSLTSSITAIAKAVKKIKESLQ